MVDKLKSLVQMSEFIASNSTQTYENWTHFLQFSGRFYKYTYDEQISIYFQRPEATAVASYEIWNQQMRRYIKRGSVGIAVIDNSGNGTRLRYLFDIADTGTRQTSRTPLPTVPNPMIAILAMMVFLLFPRCSVGGFYFMRRGGLPPPAAGGTAGPAAPPR